MGIDRAFFCLTRIVRRMEVCMRMYLCVLVVSVLYSVEDQAKGEAERANMQE